MKKRILSLLLILSILIGFAPMLEKPVRAAGSAGVSVLSYRYNAGNSKYELTVTWNGAKSTKSVSVEYVKPETAPSTTVQSVYAQEVESINMSLSRFTAVIDASSFKDDYIYGLDMKMLDSSNAQVDTGFLYFMTKMSFYSSRVEQQVTGYETGTKPELQLKWNIPKVYDGTSYVNVDAALGLMKSKLGLSENITALDYRLNISTKAQALDSGADITPVMVSKNSGAYKAQALGKEATIVNDASNTTMSFNVRGRKDLQDNSLNTTTLDSHILAHEQILPGTVYFMNIKPVFVTSTGVPGIVTVGDPSRYNGSMVTDQDSNLAYTYTPVRFQLSRDASDNIYVKVFRINKDDGSLDMPNLYYSIQAIDTPSVAYGTDWPQKAKVTGEFFPKGSEYAVTVITGVNPGTSMYYKVVVKTDNKKDRIESLKLQYQMSLDTTKPPIPIDVRGDNSRAQLNIGPVKDPVTGSDMLDSSGNVFLAKSSDVVITWQKPKSWDVLTAAEKGALNFHVLLNTNPTDLDTKYPLKVGDTEKEYLLNYRWVKVINGASADIKVSKDGQRLEYVLNGRELFKNADGTYLSNPDKYPMFLLENMVYYIRMFTTKGTPPSGFNAITDYDKNGVLDDKDIRAVMPIDDVSEKSVTGSLTTLPRAEREIPIPKSFKAVSEDIDTTTGKNFAVLQFDKVNIDWASYTTQTGNNEYYDLFMSTSNASDAVYTQIGSTDSAWTPGGTSLVDHVGFLLVNGKWNVTISGLRPNTTYYFKLKTRLDFGDPAAPDRSSAFTAVVPVTTRRTDVQQPDDATRKPVAPVDFKIALNAEGKPELTGASVAFDWKRNEDDVTYRLIATTSRVSPNAEEADYANDPFYQSFVAKFGNGVLNLDPRFPDQDFSYDALTKLCKYAVQDWLVPNSLYYFSIRAERKVTTKDANGNDIVITLSSSWVTLPVTTSLIDAPEMLETVTDIQLGVQWTDSDPMVKAEDYKLYIKESTETVYKPLGISQATIVKGDPQASGDSMFYGRIRGLKANTRYDIRAYKGNTTSGITYQDLPSDTTRDDYHQMEVRWKGLPGYKYEIAIKAEGESEYTTLDAYNRDQVELRDEENAQTQGYVHKMYYAKIKAIPVTISAGSTMLLPLKSNQKYYVKVRAIQANVQPSKYAGPVTGRTQFNQDDYNHEDEEEESKTKFIDKLEKLEQKLYWRVDMGNSSVNKILLKGDRVVNELQNNSGYSVTIDISDIAANYRRDVIYIPAVVLNCVNSNNRVITIKTTNTEYAFKPETLLLQNLQEIKDIQKNWSVKDIFLKMTITRSEYGAESLTVEVKPVSEIYDLDITAIGSSKTDAQLKSDFHDKVYNSEHGLAKQKLDEITRLYNINASAVLADGDHFIDALVEQVELELSKYIYNTIEGGNGILTMVMTTKDLKEFSSPMTVKLSYNAGQKSLKTPYVLYDGAYEWKKLSSNVQTEANSSTFNLLKTGKFVVAAAKEFATDVPVDHWAMEYINTFGSKYDLSAIFGSTAAFSPEASVNTKEIILLYETVAGKTQENAGLDMRQKAKKLGLDGLVNASAVTRDASRQEAASVLVRLYCLKQGLSPENLVTKGNIYIKDERAIADKHYNGVVMAIDLGMFTVDGNGEFQPASYITRAQVITATVRLLRLTGDL